VTTLNVPAISAYHQMANNMFSAMVIKGIISSFGYNMWTNRRVHELLWGHKEDLFELAQYAAITGNAPPFKEFGFFLMKNSSKEEELGLYTMYTGQGDPYKLANIAKFNGLEKLDRWNGSECDRVHGSDGASFNPYIQQQDTLWFFNDQLCRAMPLTFDQELANQGVPTYRFKPRHDVFMPVQYPEENACYKLDGHVIGDGLFDVRNCQFDAPIVLSWPHFLHAEDKYKDAIQGLSPKEDEHGFWFDIQPVTGTTVSAKARIQINILVRKMGWTDLQDIEQDTVVPLLWFEEGIDELGMDIITVLKRAAVDPLTYRQYILYVFTFFICIEIILAFICLIRICQSVKMTEVIDQIQQIPGSAGNHSGHLHDLEQADQPMLGADSTDTSRVTTATHSRNCSEGIKPPYIQGSSEAREKLIEDLSSRLSQKLTSQFQYNNIKDGSDAEPVVSHENLEALLPNQDQESRLPTQQEAVNLQQSAAHNNKIMLPQSAAVVRRQQVADNKESYEESLRGVVPELCVSESESEECESGSEFEGPSVALVNVKPRLTSVSSSVTS